MESPAAYRVAVGLTATLATLAIAAPAMASGPVLDSASYYVNANNTLTWTVTVTGLTPGDYLAFGGGSSTSNIDFLSTTSGSPEVIKIGSPTNGDAWTFSFTSAPGNEISPGITDSLMGLAEGSGALMSASLSGAVRSNVVGVTTLPDLSTSTPVVESASYAANPNGTLDWTFILTGLTPGDELFLGAGSTTSTITSLVSSSGQFVGLTVGPAGADGTWTVSLVSEPGNVSSSTIADSYAQVLEESSPSNEEGTKLLSNVVPVLPGAVGQLPEVPLAAALPMAGLGGVLWAARRRRHGTAPDTGGPGEL